MKTTSTSLCAVAVAPLEGAAPDWIQLTPEGPELKGRDGRRWTLKDPEAVIARFREGGVDLPLDFEHATEVKGAAGEAAPAIGWIKALEARAGAIWARVEWLAAGEIAAAEPADPGTGLTPAEAETLRTALNSLTEGAYTQAGAPRMQAVREALLVDGRPPFEITQAQVAAIQARIDAEAEGGGGT